MPVEPGKGKSVVTAVSGEPLPRREHDRGLKTLIPAPAPSPHQLLMIPFAQVIRPKSWASSAPLLAPDFISCPSSPHSSGSAHTGLCQSLLLEGICTCCSPACPLLSESSLTTLCRSDIANTLNPLLTSLCHSATATHSLAYSRALPVSPSPDWESHKGRDSFTPECLAPRAVPGTQ